MNTITNIKPPLTLTLILKHRLYSVMIFIQLHQSCIRKQLSRRTFVCCVVDATVVLLGNYSTDWMITHLVTTQSVVCSQATLVISRLTYAKSPLHFVQLVCCYGYHTTLYHFNCDVVRRL